MLIPKLSFICRNNNYAPTLFERCIYYISLEIPLSPRTADKQVMTRLITLVPSVSTSEHHIHYMYGYHTSTDFSLYKSNAIKSSSFPLKMHYGISPIWWLLSVKSVQLPGTTLSLIFFFWQSNCLVDSTTINRMYRYFKSWIPNFFVFSDQPGN